MSDKTGIEWTEATWNPVTGCAKVSQGCKHCYAERDWARMQHVPAYAGRKFTDVACHEDRLNIPLRWKKPRLIFVNSMSDLFHESVPDDFIAKVFGVMAIAKQHTFQILTKRPERMQSWISRATAAVNNPDQTDLVANFQNLCGYLAYPGVQRNFPLKNVWLGVSVEDQATADERIPLLLQTPASVRWISAEPLLGPVNLSRWAELGGCDTDFGLSNPGLDWVVVGGESGPHARPMHPDWARSVRDQCTAADVPFLFKQWGEWSPISQQTEEFTNSLYVSNRKAAPNEDQSLIDELYGQRCTVDQTVLHMDGSMHHYMEPNAFPTGAMTMYRVGKKRAGRLLEGIEHNGYPEGKVKP